MSNDMERERFEAWWQEHGAEWALWDARPWAKRVWQAARATPAPAEAQEKRATGWVAPKDRYVPPVLFNPYTGAPRDVRDVQSDPQGILLVPPGAAILAAPPTAGAERTQTLLADVRLFLEMLPRDLGRGSLNGMRAQLQHALPAAPSAPSDQQGGRTC